MQYKAESHLCPTVGPPKMKKSLERAWLSLEAAAAQLATLGVAATPDDVLHQAALGKVHAYIRLREPKSIHATRTVLKDGWIPTSKLVGGGSAFAFALLTSSEAWRLELHGELQIEYFRAKPDDPLEPNEGAETGTSWRFDEPFIASKSEVAVLPGEVRALGEGDADPGEVGESVGWPWGKHTTEMLEHLRAAGERYWRLYDPTDSTTAPTNATVAEFLKGREVSTRIAEAMATILRADGLQSGRRKYLG